LEGKGIDYPVRARGIDATFRKAKVRKSTEGITALRHISGLADIPYAFGPKKALETHSVGRTNRKAYTLEKP